MNVITTELSTAMQTLRAAELGISVEELAMRTEIGQAIEMMTAQGIATSFMCAVRIETAKNIGIPCL